MFKCLLNNIPDVVIGKAVKNVFTRLTIGNKIALSQDLKLMRYSGFCHSQKICNIANAHRLTVYGKENADACRITKHFEKVREIVEPLTLKPI